MARIMGTPTAIPRIAVLASKARIVAERFRFGPSTRRSLELTSMEDTYTTEMRGQAAVSDVCVGK
jgi:hypothetical protein